MYKIYINDNLLILGSPVDRLQMKEKGAIMVPYMGNRKSLLNYVDKLEKSPSGTSILIYHDDAKRLRKDFRKLYKYIRAAGGVVCNKAGEVLFIERLSRWDLPKGKREKGEKNQQSALREVEEETGLRCASKGKLGHTLHTYRNKKGVRYLKKTTWYKMVVNGGSIKLQTEENITGHKWMSKSDFLLSNLSTYESIRDVIGGTLNH